MPIQSGAQGLMKLSMAELHYLNHEIFKDKAARAINQVHDELLFEVREDVVEDFDAVATTVFRNCCPLLVPIECGSTWGANWGVLK